MQPLIKNKLILRIALKFAIFLKVENNLIF